jgi:hypothetical protein
MHYQKNKNEKHFLSYKFSSLRDKNEKRLPEIKTF